MVQKTRRHVRFKSEPETKTESVAGPVGTPGAGSTTDIDLSIPEGWSPKDLQANHRGWLSPRQLGLLRARMWKYLLGTVLLTTPSIVLLIVVATAEQRKSGYFIVLVIVVLSLVAPLAIVWVRVRTVRADVMVGRVFMAEGPIVNLFASRLIGQARAGIGSVDLQYYGAPWDRAWRDGLHYLVGVHRFRTYTRAYYLPRSRLLVAVEPAKP
jgi:hypothetical protein